MKTILEGVRIGADFADAARPSELSPEAAQSLSRRGQVAYRVIVGPSAAPMRPAAKPLSRDEARGQVRRRTRLRSPS